MTELEAKLAVSEIRSLDAELVVYVPGDGPNRSIWALVDRFAPGATSRFGLPSPKARITVVEHAVHGIVRADLSANSQSKVRLNYPGTSGPEVELALLPDTSPGAVNDGGLCSYEL